MSSTLQQLGRKLCDVTGVPRYFVHQSAFEFRMSLIRLNGFTPWRRLKIRRLQREQDLRLVFGCGATRYPGWIGIDCFAGDSVDLLLDLRRPLPFDDATAEYCYSEHFMEHLYPEETERHLAEVRRILKPGGVYRVAVPAAVRFAERYLAGDLEFFALAHPWEERPFDAVRKIFSWYGEHRNIYDFPQLEYLALRAGFAQILESQANESSEPILRIDRGEPQRVAETLYAEMRKA